MNEERPLGELFTEVYRNRGAANDDSERFRNQVSAGLDDLLARHDHYDFARYLQMTTGLVVPYRRGVDSITYQFDRYVTTCEIDDLLDFVTHVARYFVVKRHAYGEPRVRLWVAHVRAALETQNMNYEIDERAGMHHRVDAAFQRGRELTLACLSASGFEAARMEIESAFDFLTTVPANTKMAVVNAFLAAENVFKVVLGSGANLTETEVRRSLLPLVQRQTSSGDSALRQSATRACLSFGAWVDAAHPYRHGHDEVSVVAPPRDLAILLVTGGADFIRWLVALRPLVENGNSA